MRRSYLASLLGFACAACVVGQHLDTFEPATTAGGGTVTVKTKMKTSGYTGELVAVEDSALLLVRNDTLMRVPSRLIRSVDAPYGGGSGELDMYKRERLRLISRYPKGVTPDLERRLLEAYHQAAVKVVAE